MCTQYLFLCAGIFRKAEEKPWAIKEDITKTVTEEQHADFVQYDDPFLSNSDEDVDENMLEKRTGQVFTIGNNNRPRQISKAGKVLSRNILWQIPKGHDAGIKNGKALQRKMKGIRVDIRRTTDSTSKSWVKDKSTQPAQIGTKGAKYAFILAESTLDLPVIDSNQMLDIRDALIGVSYDPDEVYRGIGKNNRQFLYMRGEANHYDYIPSTKSVQSSVFHQALNGFVYIGARIKKVLRKKASRHYSVHSPSYDEIIPETDDVQENAPDILDMTKQYSSDEFDSTSDDSESESETSSDQSHKYDTPSSSDEELSKSSVQNSPETVSGSQTNTSVQSQSETQHSITGSTQSSQQDNTSESTAEEQSTLMPSSGKDLRHSQMTNGICIEKPPKIVIGRRWHDSICYSSSGQTLDHTSRPYIHNHQKSVRISPSCDSIYMRHLSSRSIHRLNHRPIKQKQYLEHKRPSKKGSQPCRSQSFHESVPYNKNEEDFQASRSSLTYGSCGDSICNSAIVSKSKLVKTNKTKREDVIDDKKSHDTENMHKQISTPRISARHSSENSDKSECPTSNSNEESEISVCVTKLTDPDSASYMPESSSNSSRYYSSGLSSTVSTTTLSSKAGDDSVLASGETESSSVTTSENLSVIQEEIDQPFAEKEAKEIKTLTHYIHGTTFSNKDNPSHVEASARNQDFVDERSKRNALKSTNNTTVDPVSINTAWKSNLLHPSCNPKSVRKFDHLDSKRHGEEYSNESSYELIESGHGPDSWDVSVNSTNGIPSPVVVDERMKDFSDENSEYFQSNVDECSAVATAGLGTRRPKGARPIQKIRALLNYLRGDDLIISNFLAKNGQSGDEKAKFPSEECCMMSKISPFDFTNILAGVSPKCGCIKRFEPFFEKLYEQNAFKPLAKRIVDFSLYEGLQTHNQLHPLYTEGDIDGLCDKLVYQAITKGIAEFSVIQSLSSTLLEIKSEDLLDSMTVEDVRGVVEEMVANVIADETIQQGRRAIIVESFIRDSVPNVSARITQRAGLTSMYREAMKSAIIEETRGSNKLKSSTSSKTSSITTPIPNGRLSEQDCCNKTSCSSALSSNILPSMVSKSKTELASTSEAQMEPSGISNVSLPNISSTSDNKMPHPSSGSNLEWKSSMFDQLSALIDADSASNSSYHALHDTLDTSSEMTVSTLGNSSEFKQRSKHQKGKFLSLCEKFDIKARSELLQKDKLCSGVDSKSSTDPAKSSSRLHENAPNKNSLLLASQHSSKIIDDDSSQLSSAMHRNFNATSPSKSQVENQAFVSPGPSSGRSCGKLNNDGLGNGKWISKILDSDEELCKY